MDAQQRVQSAAGNVMSNMEDLTVDWIVEAAPPENKEEAREAAREVEDLYMEVDDAMYKVQQAVSD